MPSARLRPTAAASPGGRRASSVALSNSEIERERQIAQGHPPDQEPFLPQREPA